MTRLVLGLVISEAGRGRDDLGEGLVALGGRQFAGQHVRPTHLAAVGAERDLLVRSVNPT